RRGCASAATRAPRSCWPSRSPRPPPRCAASPTGWRSGAAAFRGAAPTPLRARARVRRRRPLGAQPHHHPGMTDPADLQAVELLAAYRDRTLSPVEATSAVLARIARLAPRVTAFCLVDEAAALTAGPAVGHQMCRR